MRLRAFATVSLGKNTCPKTQYMYVPQLEVPNYDLKITLRFYQFGTTLIYLWPLFMTCMVRH